MLKTTIAVAALALTIASASALEQDERYVIFRMDAERATATAPTTPEPVATYAILSTSPTIAQMVTDKAKAHGIDPALAHAIVRVESGYNCNAVNRQSNATGIMQVLPRTARGVGVTGNLRDCATGLIAGMRYLRAALDRHGDLCAAASAYNHGIHAASRCTGYGRKVLGLVRTARTN